MYNIVMQQIKQFETIMKVAIEETIKKGFQEGKSKSQIMEDLMKLKAKFENEVKAI